MNKYFAILILSASLNGFSQTNFDSLWTVWGNTKLPDSSRFRAIHDYGWAMAFTDPDSAFVIADIQEKWARSIKNREYESDAINIKGVTWYVRGDFEKTEYYWTACLTIRESEKDIGGMSSSYNNLSNLYVAQGEYEKGIEYLDKCLLLDRQLKRPTDMAITYNNLGIIYWKLGTYSMAIDQFLKSIAIKENLKSYDGLDGFYTNLGGVYEEIGKIDKSLECHLKALVYSKNRSDNRTLAGIYTNIGIIYEVKEMYDSAEFYQNLSLDLRLELDDQVGVANTYNNLAVIKEDQKKYKEALDLNQKSLAIKRAFGDREGEAKSLANVGVVSIYLGRFDDAVESCRSGLKIGRELDILEEQELCIQCLYDAYSQMGDFKKAFEYFQLYIEIRDSLYNKEKIEEIAQSEAEFQYAKKAAADSVKYVQEKLLRDAELAKEKALREKESAIADQAEIRNFVIIAAIGVVLIVVSFFSVFLYKRFKLTQKQKRIIENQKQEVELQKDLVEEKNREITDSITYAKRLQDAILPPISHIRQAFPMSFVLYLPKDIVAGDFYWMEKSDEYFFLAVADCTGHGVPGAMVSLVCSGALNRAVREFGLTDPGEILNNVRDMVIERFGVTGIPVNDGMDIALVAVAHNKVGNQVRVKFAGAYNPIWVVPKNGEKIVETRAQKQPIGYYDRGEPFVSQDILLHPGDLFYLFSDGYMDQFGGQEHKKFKSSNFRKLLYSLADQSCDEICKNLTNEFHIWKGNLEQLDDVCVIGVRV